MLLSSTFRLRNRRWYPWLFLGFFIGIVPFVWWLLPSEKLFEGIFSALGLSGGVVSFLYSQHLQQTHLFKELFTEFNRRYDELNGVLNEIRARPEGVVLKEEDTNTLYDYFNLCAEEYMFFRAGYIDAEVWRSWCRGMDDFVKDPEIQKLWTEEIRTGSYYGFSLHHVSESK